MSLKYYVGEKIAISNDGTSPIRIVKLVVDGIEKPVNISLKPKQSSKDIHVGYAARSIAAVLDDGRIIPLLSSPKKVIYSVTLSPYACITTYETWIKSPVVGYLTISTSIQATLIKSSTYTTVIRARITTTKTYTHLMSRCVINVFWWRITLPWCESSKVYVREMVKLVETTKKITTTWHEISMKPTFVKTKVTEYAWVKTTTTRPAVCTTAVTYYTSMKGES